MNIFVTGCAGYIGSVLCDKLLQNPDNRIYGIDTFFYNNQSAIFNLMRQEKFYLVGGNACDINTYKRYIEKSDIIIPLAALVGAPICKEYPEMARQINTDAIKKLVKLLSPKQKIIFPNTNSGYGKVKKGFCTEETPMKPISIYGNTKCDAEQIVLGHANSVVLRLATVFGVSPRMRFDLMVNDFINKLVQHKFLRVYEPEFKRNFVHIEDVASCFEWMFNPEYNGVFNVGLDTANLSKLELAEFIANKLDLDVKESVEIGSGEDPDKRDYVVSSRLLKNTGFTFQKGLSDINDIINVCRICTKHQISRMGNIAWS